jgi:hypothetical protein
MKSMTVLGISLVSALSLAGCGGGNDAPATAVPPNPYVTGQYQPGATQPMACQQSGMIQLRNAFGMSQCFQTTNIADACAQVGGMLTPNSFCRRERSIVLNPNPSGKFRNNGSMAPDSLPIRVGLFPGEALKVYGMIDSLKRDQVYWDAQLIQNGMALGSASGTTERVPGMANLSITSTSTANSAQYPSQYPGQYSYPGQSPYANPYPIQPTVYAGMNGIYSAGFYNQRANPNLFILQIMYEGKIRVELHAMAISCEDGHGNSYPCQ